MFVGFLCIICF